MYEKIKVIDQARDKNLKVSQIKDFKFAKELINTIITTDEFFRACKSQPIVFSKSESGEYVATAILGIKEGKNLFVNASGEWKKSEYIPAFFRRYPFIFVQNENTLALAFDEECKEVNEKNGQSLFDGDGEATPYLKNIMEFMQNFQNSARITSAFVAELDQLELLEDSNVTITLKDEKFNLTGFKRVNEDKLNALDDEKMLKLIKSGAYKLISAHLISLTNFDKLISYQSHK